MSSAISLTRVVAEVGATDVARGIVRLGGEDMMGLGIETGGLLRISSEGGKHAFAKCFLMRPADERSLDNSVQVDGVTRMVLRVNLGDRVAISAFGRAEKATSVSLRALDSPVPPVDEAWISIVIEERPLWQGAIILVPVEGRPFRFQVESIEPSNEVCLATPRTKTIIVGPSPERRAGQLFSFSLRIEFKKRVTDHDTVSAILLKKGFTKREWKTGVILPAGTDPNLARWPQHPPASGPLPHPALRYGRIQVIVHEEGPGLTLELGHAYDETPFEKPDELLRDIYKGTQIVKAMLEDDLRIDLRTNVDTVILQLGYRTMGRKDAHSVLRLVDSLGTSPEFTQICGYRDRGKVTLYPVGSDRSLVPKGLVEISITAMGGNMYNVSFRYGLPDIEGFSKLVDACSERSASIVSLLEQNAAI